MGRQPLHWAMERGHLPLIRFLDAWAANGSKTRHKTRSTQVHQLFMCFYFLKTFMFFHDVTYPDSKYLVETLGPFLNRNSSLSSGERHWRLVVKIDEPVCGCIGLQRTVFFDFLFLPLRSKDPRKGEGCLLAQTLFG